MMLRGLEPDSEALLWKMVSVGEYRDAIHSFLKLCSGAGEEWTPFEDDMDETRLMIVKKQIIVVGEGSAVETYDDVNSSPVDTNIPLYFEYHVIYNQPFSVPQLLFTATRPDESLVPLSALHEWVPQSLISSHSGDQGKQYLWETLTQIEHPILHRPIYALHPCQTSSFITQIRKFSK
ncbi:hypothetical protein RvY_02575-2 [Ramazzottius varieornatus]|nr:hypothetical protein RvY_02575-2 [Ramazzottius varieornatus]